MLIGVELPITERNVGKIDAVQLMKAHDCFLYYTQQSRGIGGESYKEQYNCCKNEIVRRLLDLESRKNEVSN